jgi:hypothetical protein
MKRTALLVIAVFLSATAATAEPVNYADCILENMKGVSSDTAAALIGDACRAKFPIPAVAPPCALGQATCKPWEREWSSDNTMIVGSVVADSGEILPPLSAGSMEPIGEDFCAERADNRFDKYGGPYPHQRNQQSRWNCAP